MSCKDTTIVPKDRCFIIRKVKKYKVDPKHVQITRLYNKLSYGNWLARYGYWLAS